MRFKITIISLAMAMLFAACKSTGTAQYYPENKMITTMDMHQGTWLLYNIDAPYKYHDALYNEASTDFKGLGGHHVTDATTATGVLLPEGIPLNPTTAQLKEYYKMCGFDYLINLKAFEVSEDLSTIDLNNHLAKSGGSNTGRVALEIYDLKNGTILYSQTVTGIDYVAEDDTSDFHTHEKVGEIIDGCYNLVMKEFIKNLK